MTTFIIDFFSFFVSFSTGVALTLLLTRGAAGGISYNKLLHTHNLLRMRGQQTWSYLTHRGEPLKMTLVVRKDLKMGVGKIAAQCAHAAVGVLEDLQSRRQREGSGDNAGEWAAWHDAWRTTGSTKVALQCDCEEALMEALRAARREGLPHTLVRDAGRTQVASGSKTVLAVGPAPVTLVDRVTGHFKLL